MSASSLGQWRPAGCHVALIPLVLMLSACGDGVPTAPALDSPGLEAQPPLHDQHEWCTDGVHYATVYFARESAVLDDEAKVLLDGNVALLNQCPGDRFHVWGHAANGERRAKVLAQARAAAVIEYYVSRDIEPARLVPGYSTAMGCRPSGGCAGWQSVETFVAF